MKKLLLLLLVMAMVACVVFAASGPIHPPGAYSIEAVMAEYSVQEGVVTQPSDPAGFTALISAAWPSGVPAMAPDSYDELVCDKPPRTKQDWSNATTDFYLRC